MKTILALLLLSPLAFAVPIPKGDGPCGLGLEPGETHFFGTVAAAKCNHRFRHLCHHWCSHGLASEFCRACRSDHGPCGLHTPTAAECCAATACAP
jgi:hypothetical protein